MLTRIKKRKTQSVYLQRIALEKVTTAGFEPATNGAEIRHSIQLNYAAIALFRI